MTKEQKNEVIELLKGKFSQYNNFYVTDTESLTVAQVGKLRRACFSKNVEVKVAKNTLIKKALESLDSDRFDVLREPQRAGLDPELFPQGDQWRQTCAEGCLHQR